MPYTPPGTLTATPAIPRSPSSERNHHRSRSFTDEPGPGAFAPLSGIPRRNLSRPATPKFTFPVASTSNSASATGDRPASPAVRSPKFIVAGGSGSSEDSDGDDDEDVPINSAPLANKVVAAISNATANGGPPTPPPEQVPFPSVSASNSPVVITAASPIGRSVSSPQIQSPSADGHLTPSIYRSPYSSLRSEPSTRMRMPLKPALKSNHSSPHLPSLAHQRALTQSAPSTPNLSAWQASPSGGSSAPGSPGSTYSVPQTPKQVHFASEKSSLESVVVFTKGARPRSLSNPGGNDTETETEGYDSSGPSWASSRYPFPAMPKDENAVVLDENLTSEVPAKSVVGYNGYSPDGNDRRFVLLETLTLPSSKPPTLRGSVLVRNIAFQKRVAVRFTLDDWQTTSEVNCPYSASLQALPPPFSTHSTGGSGHFKSASIAHSPADRPLSNGGKGDAWDRFTFTIKLEDVERNLPNKKMYLVVRYQVPSQWGWESGGEWWDNNDTKNYEIAFKLGKRATASSSSINPASEEFSPAGLSARLAASVQRQQEGGEGSVPNRSQSLPPLPPPGAIRATPVSPLSLSPVSSVLGLKLNKPTLPLLSTNDPPPPKLRVGRGPTFAEVRNSPPGSPVARNSPTRTLYTPPLPGTVPGVTHGIITPSPAPPPPAPAPVVAPTPVEKKEDVHKPVGLTISTTGLSSPTATIGKKRGLSLSNYASPSPSHVKSPSVPNNSSTSLASLGGGGGDGGENAYKYAYRKDSGPITPEYKIVGGMPATVIDENTLPRQGQGQGSVPPTRTSSWDTPLNGFWNALGGGAGGKPKPGLPAQQEEEGDDGMVSLPTPPDSSDSTMSTPELERSPDQEVPPAIGAEKEVERDSPTPTGMTTAPAPTSFVPFPRASPTGSPVVATFAQGSGRRSPPKKTSFSSTSDADSDSGPRPLSNLGRRTSEQTGKMMHLEMPARPTFRPPPEEALAVPTVPLMTMDRSPTGSGSSSPERGSPSRRPTRRITPPLSEGNPSLGLGLNVMSPGAANGPPPEFLAKYCFFVSSPGVSPPTGTSSPAQHMTVGSPPLLNAFGTGIDTPRASSPGLANVAAFWGYPGASTVASPDNVTLSAAKV